MYILFVNIFWQNSLNPRWLEYPLKLCEAGILSEHCCHIVECPFSFFPFVVDDTLHTIHPESDVLPLRSTHKAYFRKRKLNKMIIFLKSGTMVTSFTLNSTRLMCLEFLILLYYMYVTACDNHIICVTVFVCWLLRFFALEGFVAHQATAKVTTKIFRKFFFAIPKEKLILQSLIRIIQKIKIKFTIWEICSVIS